MAIQHRYLIRTLIPCKSCKVVELLQRQQIRYLNYELHVAVFITIKLNWAARFQCNDRNTPRDPEI